MKKSAISSCVPVKRLTESVDIYLPFLTYIINQSLKNSIFLMSLSWLKERVKKLIHLIK